MPVNQIHFFDPKGSPVRGNTDYITRFLLRLGLVPDFSITAEERQFIFRDVRFGIQKVEEGNLYLYVTIDSENSWTLIQDFSQRQGMTPLALPYQEIMHTSESLNRRGAEGAVGERRELFSPVS